MKDKIKQKLSNLKNKKYFAVVFLFVLIALVGGLSYAIWNNSYLTNANTITSGLVSMSFTESSNVITISDALPMTDDNGKVGTNYFDFSVTSNMNLNSNDPDTDVDYEIILEPLSVDTDYTALTSSQIKVYLENKDTNDSLLEPTLISALTDSGTNKIILSTSHTHKYGTNTITTNYRLRAWIDMNVDSSSWTSETKYEYKFRVNINGEIDALTRPVATSADCFEFISDGNNGVKIVNYLCDESSLYQASQGRYDNKAYNNGIEEAITDVIIPSYVTISLSSLPTPNENNSKECANFFTNNVGEGTTYEENLAFCSGTGTFMGLTLEEFAVYVDAFEEYYTGLSDLAVFQMVTLPEATYMVTQIGEDALDEKDLTSVSIPSTVTSIGLNAFTYNYDITSISVDSGNTAYNDGNGSNVIIETATNTLIFGCKTSVIPNTVTAIGDYAFYYMGLTTANIPNSVITIGERAFDNNYLESITIPNSVTEIDDSAFEYNHLTSVIIPNSVTKIGEEAFANNNLSYVVINSGSNLIAGTGIGLDAFSSSDDWIQHVSPTSVTYVDSPNLATIYNNSGKAFDWNGAITGTSATAFETGTVTTVTSVGTVNITTGSPS